MQRKGRAKAVKAAKAKPLAAVKDPHLGRCEFFVLFTFQGPVGYEPAAEKATIHIGWTLNFGLND